MSNKRHKQRRRTFAKHQNSRLHQRKRKQRNLLIVGIIVIAFVAGFFGRGWQTERNQTIVANTKSEVPWLKDAEVPNEQSETLILEDEGVVPDEESEVPRISVEEVKTKLDTGSNIVIIDSRSRELHDELHITGSISVPTRDMAAPYDYLDPYEEIITYCA